MADRAPVGSPEQGSLWARAREQTRHALACGALQPIPTECRVVEQDGIGFLVRVLTPQARAQRVWKRWKPVAGFDPFLPYDEAMFVAGLSDTHVCLLNKFNVVDCHLLVVTRAFADQESLLDREDFAALWPCMAEQEGLAFYNAGAAAGASQRHKHLQVVPLPLAPNAPRLPVESLLDVVQPGTGRVPGLGFVHAFARLGESGGASARTGAEEAYACYWGLLEALGMSRTDAVLRPYNLLVTRRWMLLVPRSRESYDSAHVNALGFAGAFLMRDEEQQRSVEQYGFMRLLGTVGVAP